MSNLRSGFMTYLWNQRPRLMNNPVILRELVSRFRTKSTFFTFATFLLICTACAIVNWQRIRSQVIGAGAYYISITQILSTIEMLFILFLAPMMGAVAISQERENGSWEMLLASPTSMFSILLAKLLAPLALVLLVLFSLLPILSLDFPFGGMSRIQFIFHLLTNIEMTIQCVIIGMLCSAICQNSVKSIGTAYLIVFSWNLFVPIISQITLNTDFFLLLSPSFVYQQYLYPGSATQWMPIILKPYAVHLHYLLNSFIFAFLFFITMKHSTLNWRPSRFSLSSNLKWFLNRNRPEREIQLYPDNQNPIFIREMRERLQYNRASLVLSILFFSLLSFVLAFMVPRFRFGHGAFAILTLFLVPFMVLPGAIFALRQERDRGLWDLLLTTSLTPKQIVDAKGYINFSPFVVKLAALLFFWLLMAYLGGSDGNNSYKALPALPVTAFFMALLLQNFGMYLSVICKKSITAFSIVFAFTMLLYLGTYIISQVLLADIGNPVRNGTVTETCAILSPLYLYFVSAGGIMYMNNFDINQWYNWMGLQAFLMGGASLVFYILTLTSLQRESANSRL